MHRGSRPGQIRRRPREGQPATPDHPHPPSCVPRERSSTTAPTPAGPARDSGTSQPDRNDKSAAGPARANPQDGALVRPQDAVAPARPREGDRRRFGGSGWRARQDDRSTRPGKRHHACGRASDKTCAPSTSASPTARPVRATADRGDRAWLKRPVPHRAHCPSSRRDERHRLGRVSAGRPALLEPKPSASTCPHRIDESPASSNSSSPRTELGAGPARAPS